MNHSVKTSAGLILFLSLFLFFSIQPAFAADSPVAFSDISASDAALPFINFLSQQGAVKGYPDGTFKPQKAVTRAEAAKVLVTLSKLNPVATESNTFPDVPQEHWAFPFIETAVRHELLAGYPNGLFHPDKTLTRAELAVLSFRLAGGFPQATLPRNFTDVPEGYWARNVLDSAVDAGFLNWPQGEVRPEQAATRARLTKSLALASVMNPEQNLVDLEPVLEVQEGTVILEYGNTTNIVEPNSPQTILTGSTITTSHDGTANLTFSDGSGFRLEPGTTLVIEKAKGLRFITSSGELAASVDDLVIDLKIGQLFAALAIRPQISEAAAPKTAFVPYPQQVHLAALSSSDTDLGLSPVLVPATTAAYADGQTKIQMTFRLEDARGLPAQAPSGGISLTLSATAGTFEKNKILLPGGASQVVFNWQAPPTAPANETVVITASGNNLSSQTNITVTSLPWWRQNQTRKVRVKVNMPWGVAGIRGSFGQFKVTKTGQTITTYAGELVTELNGQEIPVPTGMRLDLGTVSPGEPLLKPLQQEDLLDLKKAEVFIEQRVEAMIKNMPLETVPPASTQPPVEPEPIDLLEEPAAPVTPAKQAGNTGSISAPVSPSRPQQPAPKPSEIPTLPSKLLEEIEQLTSGLNQTAENQPPPQTPQPPQTGGDNEGDSGNNGNEDPIPPDDSSSLGDPQTVSGVIHDSSGQTLSDVTVTLWNDHRIVGFTTTEADGLYHFEGLNTGEYLVMAGKSGLEPQFYPGVSTFLKAQPLAVSDTGGVREVDFTLEAGSYSVFLGQLAFEGFETIPSDAKIGLKNIADEKVYPLEPDDSGFFTVLGIPAGDYMLLVSLQGHMTVGQPLKTFYDLGVLPTEESINIRNIRFKEF